MVLISISDFASLFPVPGPLDRKSFTLLSVSQISVISEYVIYWSVFLEDIQIIYCEVTAELL